VAQLVLLDSKFSHLPSVLAEGRRLIGNVERVASLFVTKNVMSAVSILAAAFFGVAYPFLPSQLTLVSTLTIGIPAAALALGPNTRRYEPGFLRRVLAISVPAGVVAGISAFAVYAAIGPGGGTDPRASTAALTALLVTSFWLLGCLARPYQWWKVAVIVAMVALAALAYVTSLGRSFFGIELASGAVWYGLLAGAIGAVVVELAYRLSRHQVTTVEVGHREGRRGELASKAERPLGTRPYTADHQRHRTPDVKADHDD
jgi:cation-transporting ATPase E